MLVLLVIPLLWLTLSCSADGQPSTDAGDVVENITNQSGEQDQQQDDQMSDWMIPEFGPQTELGVVVNDDINEASGLTAGRRNRGFLWTHNDSGDSARVFVMSRTGGNMGQYYLPGIKARDWEDIAIGPGPEESIPYIFVGEIGDNDAKYDTKKIYRFPEPTIDTADGWFSLPIDRFETITFNYPDGPRDAEALMVDPQTRDIYVVSKREVSVHVYRLPWPQSTTDLITAEHIATLDSLTWATAGDINVEGTGILIKNYFDVYYWERRDGEPLAESFARPRHRLPYTLEPQGEAICWGTDPSGYYTLSEEPAKTVAAIYFYQKIAEERGE